MGFAETFKALSDPVRREILSMLKEGRKSAGEISSQFDMTAATVSYHLKQLKQAGLIYETREKNFIYYTLNTSVFEDIMMWAAKLAGGSSEKAAVRKTDMES
ncbi:MAG: winged helix-turn-helix transcriptional regulator [Lachnospiraceae bacterium]|nr:winged helix-turn-helix transcriptional regulator [Lachnospiraceae bacterium]